MGQKRRGLKKYKGVVLVTPSYRVFMPRSTRVLVPSPAALRTLLERAWAVPQVFRPAHGTAWVFIRKGKRMVLHHQKGRRKDGKGW